jgi:hypothetical protein
MTGATAIAERSIAATCSTVQGVAASAEDVVTGEVKPFNSPLRPGWFGAHRSLRRPQYLGPAFDPR